MINLMLITGTSTNIRLQLRELNRFQQNYILGQTFWTPHPATPTFKSVQKSKRCVFFLPIDKMHVFFTFAHFLGEGGGGFALPLHKKVNIEKVCIIGPNNVRKLPRLQTRNLHQCFLFSFLFIHALVDECYFHAFLYFLNFFKRRAEFSQFKMLNLKSLKKLKKKHYILILYLYYFLKMKTR